MTIRQEFETLLNKNVRKGSNAARNIEMTMFFFGFGQEKWPTLVETSSQFSADKSAEMSRERVRQIVNATIRDKELVKMLPAVQAISARLESNLLKSPEETIADLHNAGLVDADMPMKGLLNLLHFIGLNKNIDIYTDEMVTCTRYTIDTSDYLLLLNKDYAKELREVLKKAKAFPGSVGITRISLFLAKYPKYRNFESMLLKIFAADNDYWTTEYDGDTYYLCESHENKMFNIFEKVANVTDTADVGNLSESIAKAFQGRAVKKGNAYPDAKVIEEYLGDSRYVGVSDGKAELCVDPRELNDIERDMIEYLQGKEFITAKELFNHLESCEHSLANAQKTAFNSPMLVRKQTDQGIQVSLMH